MLWNVLPSSSHQLASRLSELFPKHRENDLGSTGHTALPETGVVTGIRTESITLKKIVIIKTISNENNSTSLDWPITSLEGFYPPAQSGG